MEWISVKDRPPESYEYVLLYASGEIPQNIDGPKIFVGCRGNYSKDDYQSAWGDGWIPFEDHKITHWMPLPEPPKEQNEMD